MGYQPVTKIAIPLHGFNVTDPKLTVGKLKPYLEAEGYEVYMLRYGLVGLIGVKYINDAVAMELADRTYRLKSKGYQVHVFAHSNGAAIVKIATEKYGAQIDGVVCINPALKRTVNPAPNAKFVHVYYNDEDLPVLLGRWLSWLTPWSGKVRPWGAMGRYGYYGQDINVRNFDTEHRFAVKAVGHSGVFKKGKIEFFGPLIAKNASEGG